MSRGVAELEAGEEPLGRARPPGGGRKRLADLDRGLQPALLALVEPDMRGDPESPLRWTARSLRVLAAELTCRGHRASADTVADLRHEMGFSLQGNAKTLEGRQNPDRDQQFRYINEQARGHQQAGDPVVSVDTKKKELVGAAGTVAGTAPPGRSRAGQTPTTMFTRSWASHPVRDLRPGGECRLVTWTLTMTPPRWRWSRSAAGGRPRATPPTLMPGGF